MPEKNTPEPIGSQNNYNPDFSKKNNTTPNLKPNHRKISSQKYIIAGVLTFLIFSLGLTLGILLEEERYDWAREINEQQDLEYLSSQLQYLLLDSFTDSNQNSENCAILSTTLQNTLGDLSESLSKIIAFEQESSLSQDEFDLIYRRYTLDNIRYFFLVQTARESCNMNVVSALYFYNEECEDCPNQGTVLSYYKNLLEESFLVFPINTELSNTEPMVEIMLNLHNVSTYPTLIIEEQKYQGFVSKIQLKEIICQSLDNDDFCI